MMAFTTLLAVGDESVARGVVIAVVGLLIVFCALILISLFIANLPKVLAVVARYWPEVKEPHVGERHPESLVPEHAAVLAAIGFVLHTEFQRQLRGDHPAEKS